jgi:hypothetical protein
LVLTNSEYRRTTLAVTPVFGRINNSAHQTEGRLQMLSHPARTAISPRLMVAYLPPALGDLRSVLWPIWHPAAFTRVSQRIDRALLKGKLIRETFQAPNQDTDEGNRNERYGQAQANQQP